MENLSNRVKPNFDLNSNMYPVINCIYCGMQGIPVSYITDGSKFTLCCHHIIDQQIPVLGYVTLIDLEDTEWNYEL